MVVYFKITSSYDDGRIFSQNFVLRFDVVIVYFQSALDNDDGRLFLNDYYDPM